MFEAMCAITRSQLMDYRCHQRVLYFVSESIPVIIGTRSQSRSSTKASRLRRHPYLSAGTESSRSCAASDRRRDTTFLASATPCVWPWGNLAGQQRAQGMPGRRKKETSRYPRTTHQAVARSSPEVLLYAAGPASKRGARC